jgi:hypothetical protein
VSKGTGVTLFKCKDWPLHHHENLDTALSLGGIGYVVLGVHQEVKLVGPPPADRSMPMTGEIVEWYCLERVHDGCRRDIKVSQVVAQHGFEAINAMEVLARVHKGHGVGRSTEETQSGET